MSNKLNAVQNNSEGKAIIANIVFELRQKATSFYDIGNASMGDLLSWQSKALERASKKMDTAFSDMLYDYVQRSGEASDNLVNGVLTGIKVGHKD